MASKMQARWRDMDHSGELLIDHQVTRSTTRTSGPIPEFLSKKAAEREPKTYEWYRDALNQLWTFLEERGLTTVGDLSEHSVRAGSWEDEGTQDEPEAQAQQPSEDYAGRHRDTRSSKGRRVVQSIAPYPIATLNRQSASRACPSGSENTLR